ncbi:MAG: hypothetical protein OEV01_03755 [Nitrospira sp.]|nr:hypothetical protein [Nitrospira sp.]MDH4304655.1 hypothetical protein [Nitrospira sp.]MDH5194157.1 hypothetical protein [Nitrospira sp.]
MSRFPLVLAIVLAFPVSGFAQFVDRGEYVEVSKGVKLCSPSTVGAKSGILDSEKRFWRVTSKPRVNGTQTVEAFILESAYDRKSGETTIEARPYDEGYATRFKRATEQKGVLLMVSPRDGEVEAMVEICKKVTDRSEAVSSLP